MQTIERVWEMILGAGVRRRTLPEDVAYTEPSWAEQLLRVFRPLCPGDSGWVIGQLGQSLDGRIATASGASRYINGDDGLTHLHRLRAVADAVVVGAGTALEDNPRLTVRRVAGAQPVRVVVDRRDRLPVDHHLLADEGAPTLHLVAGDAIPERDRPCPEAGVTRVPCLDPECETIDPDRVLAVLARFGLTRVFVEGGGRTVSAFLTAGRLDRLHVMVAPMIIGSGYPAFTLPAVDRLQDAIWPEAQVVNLGSDVLFDLDLRRSGAAHRVQE
ncbi:RibD family protein [Salicola sp. Rm-C-2C1-2]|uniref:RibD family protein n=1 Tax=Salicola sp. Rm-C-2C1-2 TaxID=3141321 RepID=UPI0032E476CB